ncbi:GT4 family glycosyltransferase PelF [Glaciimonas sp. PCH181]|uniref:GT4 family glycosyltransferase PelF n=1 Tax=Glaciimonas sp. PCH181 TaxID=2133943 RepID=UPI000D3A59ED|nr:GT4 family glycosyltransferase PelF [Glaciimonas sp. PCH181]PUA17490.1 glycosyl transferase family 1 [Glaciimonas sp. PCH181]
MKKSLPRAASADIALLLEGTFPYVRGGVSSWVNQMIQAFPQYTFACIFVGSREEDYGEMAYALPPNVVHLEVHYLYEFHAEPTVVSSEGNPAVFDKVASLHEALRNPAKREEATKGLRESMNLFGDDDGLSESQFLYSRKSWEYITEQYRKYCTDPSFTDYFWTVRLMHKPLWQMMRIANNMIDVKLYHTISTGYAGFLGSLLHHKTNRPLITSEHGIYTKERKIDLFQNQWIQDNRSVFEKDISQVSYFRNLWVRFFETLGHVCYDASTQIVALFEGNRQRQILDGADIKKTMTIPNGVDLTRLAKLRDLRPATPPKVLCLMGRVVPIKDIKTFIRAMLTVTREMPEAEGWIAGPEDEDKEYASECRNLVESFGLTEKVKFLGYQNINDLLPKCGVLILSSISEALPLVVLEGFAAGVPSVTTDVGSCRQLIYGAEGEDAALGAAGAVVRIADPISLAAEALKLLRDDNLWHAAQRAGIARVEKYYTQELMVSTYQELYSRLLASSTPPAATDASKPKLVCPMANMPNIANAGAS